MRLESSRRVPARSVRFRDEKSSWRALLPPDTQQEAVRMRMLLEALLQQCRSEMRTAPRQFPSGLVTGSGK
jgi:hypothetical protein